MGQAELRSSGLLSPKSGPLVKGVANSNIKTEANQPLPARNDRSDRIEAPLPVTPERLELIKAYARGRARIADEAATSRIAQRFAPRTPDAPPPAAAARPAAVPAQTVPLTGLNAGIRRLAVVLIAAALIPNLTLAVLWLGRETIYRDGKRVGWLTSGGYGHTIGRAIGYGYVRDAENGVTRDELLSGSYQLEVATARVPAKIFFEPLYDPAMSRIKS